MRCPTEVRVFLLARYPVIRAGLRRLLETVEGLQVIGEAASGGDALALCRVQTADVILVDPDSREVSLTVVRELADARAGRVLVLTAAAEPDWLARAVELGASGVVTKEQSPELLVRAIQKVHAGELWLDRSRTATVLMQAIRRVRDPELMKIESLTRREREIVGKVGEGLKNGVIAEQLFISEATVRNHLTSILSKLGLSDRFELAVYAFRHELVARPERYVVSATTIDDEARRAREPHKHAG